MAVWLAAGPWDSWEPLWGDGYRSSRGSSHRLIQHHTQHLNLNHQLLQVRGSPQTNNDSCRGVLRLTGEVPEKKTPKLKREKYLPTGLSIRKLPGNSGLFFTLQNFLAKLVFQLGHFAPKSFAHFLYSTIMGVGKWERDLWWLSLFDRVLIEKPPCLCYWHVHINLNVICYLIFHICVPYSLVDRSRSNRRTGSDRLPRLRTCLASNDPRLENNEETLNRVTAMMT